MRTNFETSKPVKFVNTTTKFLVAFLVSIIAFSCQNNEVTNEVASQKNTCDSCNSLYKNELFYCLPKYFVRDIAFDSTFNPNRYDEEIVDKWKYISTSGYKTLIATDSLGQIWEVLHKSIDAVIITTYKVKNSQGRGIASFVNQYLENLYALNYETQIVKKKYSKKDRWNMFEVAYCRPYHNILLFKYEIYVQQGMNIFELKFNNECYQSDTAKMNFLNKIEKIKICSTQTQ